MTRHTDKEYEAELRDLRETILVMAGRCEEMIENSIRALVDRDSDLANKTIAADHTVNRDELRIDELCFLILAKRQPVASDLRFITQALKMANEMERISDLAVNISERALLLNKEPQLKPYIDVPRMKELVQKMVRNAIDAFVSGEVDKAYEVIKQDDEVDALYQAITRELLKVMTRDIEAVERGIHIQSVAKFLERMADHSENLAEQVIFMIKGKDVRNTDLPESDAS
ncbi:MAG: phosphate signaling complex protein PhoU [Deltaproteobacteria bacterium]|nr:phosphate signaling complex protein PhoU [Deltaproteobacteria bacterium]